jgi:tetratricopeptide (TPR) repeat protein
MNRDQIEERIEKCRQIMVANPKSQIFAALAEAYRKLGDLKMALDVCNDGLHHHPDYGSAYLVLAKIARDQKRFAEAEKAARRAIELEGRTRSAELLLSDVYLQTGQFVKAEEILGRLSEADPQNESVKRLRSLVKKASKAASVSTTGSVPVRPSVSSKPAAEAAPKSRTETEVATLEKPLAASVAVNPELSWEAVMATMERYPHLLGKLTVGYDGMLLDTDLHVRSEAERTAAMAAELFGSVRSEWPTDRFGAVDQLLVETGEASWWIWPFPEFLLVLWCDPKINMGPLRMRLRGIEPAGSRAAQGGTS